MRHTGKGGGGWPLSPKEWPQTRPGVDGERGRLGRLPWAGRPRRAWPVLAPSHSPPGQEAGRGPSARGAGEAHGGKQSTWGLVRLRTDTPPFAHLCHWPNKSPAHVTCGKFRRLTSEVPRTRGWRQVRPLCTHRRPRPTPGGMSHTPSPWFTIATPAGGILQGLSQAPRLSEICHPG